MSNNKKDLIRRGDVLAMAAEYECEDYNDMAVSVDDINDIPAAPQPMSAVEYERTIDRLVRWCNERPCDCCEYENNCPSSYRPTPEERVEDILKWAKEHPEEVEEC